jgi:serine O-acetyltransferase
VSLLQDTAKKLVASYREDTRGQRLNRHYLPSRKEIVETIQLQLALLYPGYYGVERLTSETVEYQVGVTLAELAHKLEEQTERCLCFDAERLTHGESKPQFDGCAERARLVTQKFIERLPELRKRLIGDLQAAIDGDPAAQSMDEILLAYPGFLAVTVYRLAHELHQLGIPLMPRIMTEWAHSQTGADIHPGARIGAAFFVDHATGVVVGETSDIGDRVKLYQGVTLGALSFPRDSEGRLIRQTKRHPTVEDGATIYANATILGGKTVVGEGSVIGGSVFVTRTVAKGSRVALKPPDLSVNPLKGGDEELFFDFEI